MGPPVLTFDNTDELSDEVEQNFKAFVEKAGATWEYFDDSEGFEECMQKLFGDVSDSEHARRTVQHDTGCSSELARRNIITFAAQQSLTKGLRSAIAVGEGSCKPLSPSYSKSSHVLK